MADAKTTYAVVVAIEQYVAWSPLPGLCQNACAFAQWLHDTGVPLANIQMFLAPIDRDSVPEKWRKFVGADQTDIHTYINETLSAMSGELLYIYWSGHGVFDMDRGTRRLFSADARQKSPYNFELNNLKSAVSSFAFGEQRYFIDACANRVGDAMLPLGSADAHFVSIGSNWVDPYVIMSTSNGKVAANDVFSKLLVDELQRCDSLSLDMDKLFGLLKIRCGVTQRVVREKEGGDVAGDGVRAKTITLKEGFDKSVVYKLCDRVPQTNHFFISLDKYLAGQKHRPLCYLIHGEEYEKHETLVERLYREYIMDITDMQPVKDITLDIIHLDLPEDPVHENFTILYARALERYLCSNYQPGMQPGRSTFQMKKDSSDFKTLVIPHRCILTESRIENIDALMRDLDWCINTYWNPSETADIPQVFAFFEVIYPVVDNVGSRPRSTKQFKRIKAGTQKLRDYVTASQVGLDELTPPTRDDIKLWIANYTRVEDRTDIEHFIKKVMPENPTMQQVQKNLEMECQSAQNQFRI